MTKITGLPVLAVTQLDDVLPVVDVHDQSQAASGTTKQVTAAVLLAAPVPLKSVTMANTTAVTDRITLCNAAGGGFTNALPDAAAVPVGIPYTFKKTDVTGNEVKLLPAGTQAIDGAPYIVLAAPNAAVTLRSDGSNWWVF